MIGQNKYKADTHNVIIIYIDVVYKTNFASCSVFYVRFWLKYTLLGKSTILSLYTEYEHLVNIHTVYYNIYIY